MTQPDDLAARVAALETEVRDLAQRVHRSGQDAAAARILAGGADRDVAEIRTEIRDFRQATTASFNAMREDIVDLSRRLDAVEGQLDAIKSRLDAIEGQLSEINNGFLEVRGRLDAAAAGQQQIVDLLTTLIDRQDGR